MSPYKFFKAAKFLIYVAVLVLGGYFIVAKLTVQRIRRELYYHSAYGPNWIKQYETDHGSLFDANVQIAIGIVYLIGFVVFLIWIYHRYRTKNPRHMRRRH